MKKILIIVLSLFFISIAYADRDSDDDHGKKMHKKHNSVEKMFNAMDLNKDGSISFVELKEVYEKEHGVYSRHDEDEDNEHHRKSKKYN